jgi:hypothetical protein
MRHASLERMAFAPRQPSRALFEQAHAPVKIKAPPVYRRARVLEDSDDDSSDFE